MKHSLWVTVFLFIFSSITGVQVEASDIDGALIAAEEIENPYDKASALRRIAEVQTKALDTEGAKVTLQRALEVAEKIEKNPYGKALTLKRIAEAQVKALDTEGAKVTFQMAIEVAEKIEDPYDKAWVIRRIAQAQAEAEALN